MLARRMPWAPVPCSVWLPHFDGWPDVYGNERPTYTDEPDVVTTCCYAPGWQTADTYDDFDEERPYGDRASMTFFLPKTFDADLRGAIIACSPSDDTTLASRKFDVVGTPYSYMRANTPGDYSWAVRGVEHLG